jgi:Mrp family chromosome partitioning ATPase
MEAVRHRAQGGPCTVTLLVPKPYWDPDTEEAELVVELAVPLLEQAAGRRVDAVIGDSDPVEAVRQLVAATAVDEVIVSTLPERVSRWLRRDVPSRLRALGLPVTVVTAEQSSRSLLAKAER